MSPTLEDRGLALRAHRFPASNRVAPHEHAEPVAFVVVSGAFTGSVDRRVYHCSSGDFALLPGNVRHAAEIGDRGVSSLVVSAASGDFGDVLGGAVPAFGVITGARVRTICWRLGVEWSTRDDAAPLAVEHHLAELFDLAAHGDPAEIHVGLPAGLRRARELLEESLFRTPRLDEVAAQAGMSRAHLTRTFRRAFGCSVGAFLRRRRLDRAALMLRDTGRPINDVALEMGFYDQSHFTGAFRRWIGCSPGAFRRMQGARRAYRD